MIRFVRELRRREVFRTLGLYVGGCWILIEVSSVLGPVFGAPPWLLRAEVLTAIVGFPIVGVLAWVYDLTEHGIEHDRDHAGEPPGLFGRKMDFVAIGVLSIALALSVYLNVTKPGGGPESPEPVSVLIADFVNGTGDTIFDGLIEQALTIGVEGAPHVMAFAREEAQSTARELRADTEGLPTDVAELVAVREGVKLVLSGSIEPAGRGFELNLRGLDPASGEARFDVERTAATREAVLAAVGGLAEDVRKALGDPTLRSGSDSATAEAFTAASIEAARAYMDGVQLAFEGRHAEAVERLEVATDLDKNLGRAYAGLAVSEFKLGNRGQAEEHWNKALSLMGTMTQRERLRTLGGYYALIRGNYEQAVETFSELVEKYPADAAGRNNLAVAAFYTLDFDTAAAEGRRVLEMFPSSQLYRSNYALYAMYSGDFASAAAEARTAIESNPAYGTSYVPLAISELAMADYAGARATYARMMSATASEHTESVATLGLADIAIYRGDVDAAREILTEGIASDLARNVMGAAAVKEIALAEAYMQAGQTAAALEAVNAGLELDRSDLIKAAAALVLLDAGETTAANLLGAELTTSINPHSRAYGSMIDASIKRRAGQWLEAISQLGRALETADLWRVRYERALAYLDGGYFAEAFDEFETCRARRGEATAMYLDDLPTFRALATLPYWLARAQQSLGMQQGATESYRSYLDVRPEGPLADDARERMQ